MYFLGGDWRFFWNENLIDLISLPSAWDSSLNTGIGKSAIGTLWINSYLNFTALITKIGLPWDYVSLLFWILPSIIASFFSAYYLYTRIINKKITYGIFAGLVYSCNTYFLMILFGGQLGVSLSYSLIPLVLLFFIRVFNKLRFINSLIFGIILSFQLLFDPRIVYVTLLILFVYVFLNYPAFIITYKKQILYSFIYPFIIVFLIHSYWVLPLLISKSDPLPSGFGDLSSIKFFSFANFEQSISLLHPNWPENIFGKVYFMRPEFIILPILAFLSILFLNLKNKVNKTLLQLNNQNLIRFSKQQQNGYKITILFFSLIALIGAFLAKGANPPFGEIYLWLFQYVPGFTIFRDPTKWYMLVAVSYSMLIPFSVWSICDWLKSQTKFQINLKNKVFNLQNIFLVITISCLLFLIRPLFLGQVRGLSLKPVPEDYVLLKNYLVRQPEFFRILWMPQWQRFGYFSNLHPAIGRRELINQSSASAMIKELDNPNIKKTLNDLSVAYIIVPYDSEGEIFLSDQKYSENEYLNFINGIKNISWIKHQQKLGRNILFEVDKNNIGKFWMQDKRSNVLDYISDKPYEYRVNLKDVRSGDLLVFSEKYDRNWFLENDNTMIKSLIYDNLVNSFRLTKSGDYSVKIYYKPQDWVNLGVFVCLATLVLIGIFLGINRRKNKR